MRVIVLNYMNIHYIRFSMNIFLNISARVIKIYETYFYDLNVLLWFNAHLKRRYTEYLFSTVVKVGRRIVRKVMVMIINTSAGVH